MTFVVGDRVIYTGDYRAKGTKGVIDRPAPGTYDGWFVMWEGTKFARTWTDSCNLKLDAPAAPEEYESWFQ